MAWIVAAILVGSIILLGILGIALESQISSYLKDFLFAKPGISSFHNYWMLSLELVSFILFLSVSGIGIYLYILDGEMTRGEGKSFLEILVKIVLLSSASFIIYNFLTEFSTLSTRFIITQSGKELSNVFPHFKTGEMKPLKFLTTDLAKETVWSFLMRGFYTLGSLFLLLTLAIRKIIVLVGTGIFPLSITLNLLPFKYTKNLGDKMLKIVLTSIFLPVLDVFILAVPLTLKIGLFTHVSVFWAAAIINYGLIKQSLSGTITTGLKSTTRNARKISPIRKTRVVEQKIKKQKETGKEDWNQERWI